MYQWMGYRLYFTAMRTRIYVTEITWPARVTGFKFSENSTDALLLSDDDMFQLKDHLKGLKFKSHYKLIYNN